MDIANLVLPIFAVILTGWLAGASGYMPRSLAGPLVQFAYYVAMPALVFLTIAEQPRQTLLDWRFLLGFGGGSSLCFVFVLLGGRLRPDTDLSSRTMLAAAACMTNTGFVALPILQAIYGPRGVLSAAIATVFIGVVMMPATIILLEISRQSREDEIDVRLLVRKIAINPVMISTGLGLMWSVTGHPVPSGLAAYTSIFGQALTPCALFSIGLSLSLDEMRSRHRASAAMTGIKLVLVPLVVYALCRASGLRHDLTVAAVVCAAVPTAKTAYVLAGEYGVEQPLVAATVSMTTLLSVATLLGWLYALG